MCSVRGSAISAINVYFFTFLFSAGLPNKIGCFIVKVPSGCVPISLTLTWSVAVLGFSAAGGEIREIFENWERGSRRKAGPDGLEADDALTAAPRAPPGHISPRSPRLGFWLLLSKKKKISLDSDSKSPHSPSHKCIPPCKHFSSSRFFILIIPWINLCSPFKSSSFGTLIMRQKGRSLCL